MIKQREAAAAACTLKDIIVTVVKLVITVFQVPMQLDALLAIVTAKGPSETQDSVIK